MFVEFTYSMWRTTLQLAPWLLLGMALSGLAHIVLPPNWIRRRFRGLSGVFSAVSLGVPLPLCSCGVIPAGIGLKNDGASDGAAIGFLISTPQTGVDSILVSASFFGWPFALFKMLGALVLGLLGGAVAEWSSTETPSDRNRDEAPASPDRTTNLPANEPNASPEIAADAVIGRRTWRDGVGFALEILRSIWWWLVIGIAISAAIDAWVPTEWIQAVGDWGLLPSMLVVLVISLPLYVCATASVPIAAALVSSGFPPASALVFLMAGPATNATTIAAVLGRFGRRILAIYLATIVVGSLLLAGSFAFLVQSVVVTDAGHVHETFGWWEWASALFLITLMGYFAFESLRRTISKFRSSVDRTDEQVIEVRGMNCQGCVQRLTRCLERVEGVEHVEVQLNPAQAVVVGPAAMSELQQAARSCGLELLAPDEAPSTATARQ